MFDQLKKKNAFDVLHQLIKPPSKLPVNYVPKMNALGALKSFKHL